MGIISFADLVDYAIENTIDAPTPRLEHINTFDDRISIRDNHEGHSVDVWVRNGKLTCDFCQTDNCIHIGFALSLKEVQKAMVSHGTH